MKCINECGKEATGKSNYCSASCKTEYNRNKKRNKNVGVTGVTGVTNKSVAHATTLTDACGNVHQIDYAGRRADAVQLKLWLKCEGTPAQYTLARAAQQHSIIRGFRDKAGRLTQQGRRYMGEAS